MKLGQLFWLILLIVYFLALVASSSPSKKSAKLATRQKQASQWSEKKKKRSSTRDVISRRSAYLQEGSGGEKEQREDEDEELKAFERRGYDKYGSSLTDAQLDRFVEIAMQKLYEVEANPTIIPITKEITESVAAITAMATSYGFYDVSGSNMKKRSSGDSATDEVEDENAEDAEEDTKREETKSEDEDLRSVRAARKTIAARDTIQYTGFGTILYSVTGNVTISTCRNICKADSICDSYLLIINSGLCVLHQDL